MNSKEYLRDILVGKWEKIVVQGDQLERSPSSNSYLLSGLWIYCLNNWIEISANEYKAEDFRLSIQTIDTAPIPEPSRFNNPPRQLLVTFPKDCRLDKMSTDGVQGIDITDLEELDGVFFTPAPLIIQSFAGDKIEIMASKRVPGNIEIKSA